MTQKLSNYLAVSATPDLQFVDENPSERLYPPGTVYHILASTPTLGSKYDVLEESAPSLFYDIILSNKMFLDHFPDVYEASLNNLHTKLITKLKEKGKNHNLTEHEKEILEQYSHEPQESITQTIQKSIEEKGITINNTS
jgi:hypothetical protein